jgi:hypothetical protein
MGYTYAQLLGFLGAAARRERDRIKWQAVTARAAQYDAKGFKAFMRGLDNGK